MVHNFYRVGHNLYFHSKTPSGNLITELKIFSILTLKVKCDGLLHIRNFIIQITGFIGHLKIILTINHEELLHG